MMNFQLQVQKALEGATGAELEIEWRLDRKGVATGWCVLPEPGLLLGAASALVSLQARLSTITAYLSAPAKARGIREIAYHFDLDGTTLTLTVELPIAKGSVPSLVPLFRNADWNEREFMELYDIEVTGHPDPRPLFIDPSLQPALFDSLVPYSAFTNGASGKTLWQKLAAGGAKEKP